MDVVYISTLSRPENLKKVVPYWLDQDMQVRLVVERIEYGMHNALKRKEGWGRGVYILPLPQAWRGLGYSRNYAIKHASRTALKAVILSDDDIHVNPSSDAYALIDEAMKPGVLGVGGVLSIHDMFTDGAISKMSGPILCPGGWGFRLYSMNVQTAIDCGNFNPQTHTAGEDIWVALQGISRGMPWRVHCDVKCVSIGKRFTPGGHSARFTSEEKRAEAERDSMEVIYKAWPKYVSEPDKKRRISWQKMLDDHIPDWREASALHGGSLDKLKLNPGDT